MADKTFNVRLQLLCDTESNLDTKKPLLLKGEIAICTNVGTDNETKLKIGDGVTPWENVPYLEMGGGSSEITINGTTSDNFTITPASIGAVANTTTVNGKALSGNISLAASDVSALPADTSYVSSVNNKSGAITIAEPPSIILSSTQPSQTVVGSLWLRSL